jgi:hypothetical protein
MVAAINFNHFQQKNLNKTYLKVTSYNIFSSTKRQLNFYSCTFVNIYLFFS